MGCTSSSNNNAGDINSTSSDVNSNKAKQVSKAIENANQRDMQADSNIKKLLLLGAGESGKSTLFKQISTLYGKGFSDEDISQFKRVIQTNIISGMQTLIEQTEVLPSKGIEGCQLGPGLEEDAKAITEFKVDEDSCITPEIAARIKRVWQDPGIQVCVLNRSHFQLPDSISYLIGRIDAIAQPDYRPSKEDIMRARSRTTGIVHVEFEIENTQFSMFDVGGQRNERRKWIYCFDNVTAVLFVVAISEYDQTCFEDETTNRIDEALKIFGEIAQSPHFKTTNIILFLNKRDLFEDKFKRVPLTVYDPNYPHPRDDVNKAFEYFAGLFTQRKGGSDQLIYTHVTCATDQNNVQLVFNSVKDTIVRSSLRQGGILDV